MKSRIFQIMRPGQGALVTVDTPEPGPGQLIVRVRHAGVCASELAAWVSGAADGSSYPGHEPVGEVVAVGPGADPLLGAIVGGRIRRSFAEYAIAELEDIVVIPPDIDPATIVPEPLGCVVEALRRTRVPLGARVAVIGLGYMGLVMTQLLRNLGVATLVAVDPRADARRAALASGADIACEESELPASAFVDTADSGDSGFDVVFEASGSQAGLDLSTRLVRPHGTLSILGYHQSRRQVDMRLWNRKAIDVVNGHVRDASLLRRSTEAAFRLQSAGRIDAGRLVTHRYRFDRIDDAFRALQTKPDGFVKAVVDIAGWD